MSEVIAEAAVASHPTRARSLFSLPSCIRFDEVIVLQGTPLIGAILSIGTPTADKMVLAATAALCSLCLVAHVFVLNDWSGIDGDLRDLNRASRAFTTKGVSRREVGYLATALLMVGLPLAALLGTTPFVLALAIASLSALYSAPPFYFKGLPVFNSLLHLIGGVLHFLFGYATFAVIDARAVAISCFFGLVFTAGHLTTEVRDSAGDAINGIRTNAVVFGKRQSFMAGLALFTAADALLFVFAAAGILPHILVLVAALYPFHLHASLRALRAGFTFDSLRQLQGCYRLLFGVIGATLVTTVVLGW